MFIIKFIPIPTSSHNVRIKSYFMMFGKCWAILMFAMHKLNYVLRINTYVNLQ